MLATELGEMNEVAADLYADTGDPRWLALSGKFEHRAMIDPLAAGQDILGGKHGNTQVPKMIGSLSRYIYTGDETDHKAATFFWDEVAMHHSFATGGPGEKEYLSQPDKLNNMIDGRTAGTCDVYNMIKMSRTPFSVDRKSTRLNSSHSQNSYADFCLRKKLPARKGLSLVGAAYPPGRTRAPTIPAARRAEVVPTGPPRTRRRGRRDPSLGQRARGPPR